MFNQKQFSNVFKKKLLKCHQKIVTLKQISFLFHFNFIFIFFYKFLSKLFLLFEIHFFVIFLFL